MNVKNCDEKQVGVNYRLHDQRMNNYVTLHDVIEDRYLQIHVSDLVKRQHIINAMPSQDAFMIGVIAGHDAYAPSEPQTVKFISKSE